MELAAQAEMMASHQMAEAEESLAVVQTQPSTKE